MQRVLLAVIILLAAIVRFWGLRFGLPHTNTRPDETIVIDVALAFLRGNFRPAFYDYPWLYMWVISGLYLLYYVWGLFLGTFHSVADLVASWRVNWTPFFLIPRALTALMGTATVLVVFRIGRSVWDETTGLVAALFMALAFLHVRDSHYATTDVSMICLLMLSILFLIKGHLTNRRRDFVVGGIVGGLAAATKYNALLLIAPLMASYLVHVFEQPGLRAKRMLDGRLFVYGIPFLMTFAIGVPFLAFDLPNFVSEMRALDASMEIGSRGLELSYGWIHHLQYSLRYGLGLPLMLAGIVGMLAILVLQPGIGIVLLSFPITYYAIAGSVKNLFFRYAIPVVPFLCIAAARFVTWAVPALLQSMGLRVPSRLTPLGRAGVNGSYAIAAMAIVVVLPSAISVIRFDHIIRQTDNRVVVARWFDQNIPAGSSVLMSGSAFGYVQFTRAMDYKAWVWDRNRHVFVTDLDRRPGVGRPEWILVQDSPLPFETQDVVKDFLRDGYAFVNYFPAFSRRDDHLYDQQDQFFVPFGGFRGVDRPGPNYTLYKRISAP